MKLNISIGFILIQASLMTWSCTRNEMKFGSIVLPPIFLAWKITNLFKNFRTFDYSIIKKKYRLSQYQVSANVEHVCRLKIHNGFAHVDQDYMTQETIYFQQIFWNKKNSIWYINRFSKSYVSTYMIWFTEGIHNKFSKRKKYIFLKFIYSEKTTKFCELFTLLLSYVVPVKSKVKI